MKMKAIHHISLVVADVQVAVEFYCGVLGLSLSDKRPDLPFVGAWLDIGEQQLHLIEQSSADLMTDCQKDVSRDAHVAILLQAQEGQALSQLKQRLMQHQISFTQSQRRAALFCRDPDGNGLEFIEGNTA